MLEMFTAPQASEIFNGRLQSSCQHVHIVTVHKLLTFFCSFFGCLVAKACLLVAKTKERKGHNLVAILCYQTVVLCRRVISAAVRMQAEHCSVLAQSRPQLSLHMIL